MELIQTYPGYGNPCNQCGECCKSEPCAVSKQFNLWRNGKCKALAFRQGKYWCDVVSNPGRIGKGIPLATRKVRASAIGITGKCDAKKTEGFNE